MAGRLTRLRTAWTTRIRTLSWPCGTQATASKKTVLFYRDFRGFTGGHLKVWHYFNHVQHATGYRPLIAFSADTLWDSTNPWRPMRDEALPAWNPEQADILFLAGMDWTILSETQRCSFPKPVINLIQHVRHADPDQPLYQYLTHRAIRICVSEPVAEALQATRRVNGPLFTIPNGIEPVEQSLPVRLREARDLDVLIVGIKQPALAATLDSALKTTNLRVRTLTEPVPRPAFLESLRHAEIAVFLPHATEGFYLPALEGMALETLIICPDCIGNRTFCWPGVNCLQPAYRMESLLQAIQQALRLSPQERQALLKAGRQTAQRHSLEKERQSFLEILRQVDRLW